MSAKKSPVTRRAATPKAATPAATQTVSERRAAEAATLALIESMTPEHARLIASVRRSLRKRLPSANEIVYQYRTWFVISYSPTTQGFEGVLAIRGDAAAVKLYFNRGKTLADPDKLLQGSGTQARFITVESPSTLKRPPVARLMELAIASNPVKFAAEGTGAVLLRPTSAKKPRDKSPA